MIKNAIRRRISNAAAVSGKDVTTLARDLQDAVLSIVDMLKVPYHGYAAYPIGIAVPQQPWAILCARIQPSANVQATAPQGGFCAFAYDAGQGIASITSINAIDSVAVTALPTNVLYDFSFLVVF